MDKTDFEAHVGLPITDEQFEAFKLLYKSGCFIDWQEFARKAQSIVDWLYLPVGSLTHCSLKDERRRWWMVSDFHPTKEVRKEAKEIYTFLRELKMWFASEGVIFRNELVEDHIVDILLDLHIDGVCIDQYGKYSEVELEILALVIFCGKLPDTLCSATGRLWKDEMKEVVRNLVDHGWDQRTVDRWYTRKKEVGNVHNSSDKSVEVG